MFVMVITALLLLDTTGQIPVILLATIIHEAGHLIVMGALHRLPRKIRFLPFAIDIVAGPGCSSPLQEALIHSSGILSNIICFIGSLVGWRFWPSELLLIFAAANLGILLFNLFPVLSLDGWHIVHCLLSAFGLCEPTTDKIMALISTVFLSILCGAGIFLTIRHYNPTLLLFCIYVFILSFSPKKLLSQ